MDSVTKILRNQYDNLYSAEKKVVDYILSYPKKSYNDECFGISKRKQCE